MLVWSRLCLLRWEYLNGNNCTSVHGCGSGRFFFFLLQPGFDFFLTADVSHRGGLQDCGGAVMCLARTFGSLEGYTPKQL